MKVAVIGIGKLGQRHLDKWLEIEGVEIVGIVARRESELSKVAKKYQTAYYKNIDALLLEQKVDVIDICTPTHTHAHFIKEAAHKKVDIICEKPIALTYSEAEEMIALCHKQNVQLFIAHTLEFFPIYEITRAYVEEGLLGKDITIKMSRGVAYPAEERDWYKNEAKSGGLFLDLGVHEFEWIVATFGPIKSVSTKKVRFSKTNDRTVIFGLVSLEMIQGSRAEIELSWDESDFQSSFSVSGDKGKITFKDTDEFPIVEFYDGQTDSNQFSTASSQDPFIRQLEHFKRCIEGTEKPLLSNADAAGAVLIAELARKSIQEGLQEL